MATCGCCKAQGQTVDHIKSCYETRRAAPIEVSPFVQAYVASRDFQPMATATTPWGNVPDSKFALVIKGNIQFYEVRTGSKGKWKGFRFLDRLVGHPGDWARYPVQGSEKKAVMAQIAEDPKAAASSYGKHFTLCGVCNSPLSDPESVAAGIGPVCATRF
jgi:hypothetical protein